MGQNQLVTCNACGGRYVRFQRDGGEYFHACPAFRVVDDGPVDPKDESKGRLTHKAPIANPRDENLGGVDDDGQPLILSAGDGVTITTDPKAIAAFFEGDDTV